MTLLQPHTPYGLDAGWCLSAYVDDDGHLNLCISHEAGGAILDTERTTGENPLDLRFTTTTIEQEYAEEKQPQEDYTWASHNPLAFNVDGELRCPPCTPQEEREADYTAAVYSDTPWYPGETAPFHCECCGTSVPLTPGDDQWYTQWKTPM